MGGGWVGGVVEISYYGREERKRHHNSAVISPAKARRDAKFAWIDAGIRQLVDPTDRVGGSLCDIVNHAKKTRTMRGFGLIWIYSFLFFSFLVAW